MHALASLLLWRSLQNEATSFLPSGENFFVNMSEWVIKYQNIIDPSIPKFPIRTANTRKIPEARYSNPQRT